MRKAILTERLWGMVLVITLKLLSKTVLLYIIENSTLVSVLTSKRLVWMCGQIIFIALDFYTIPYIIDLMKQRKRRQWDKESIRILRRHLGATQRKLAEELGTRQQTISEWEIGMYRPRGTSATLLSIIAERSGFNYRLEEEDEEH